MVKPHQDAPRTNAPTIMNTQHLIFIKRAEHLEDVESKIAKTLEKDLSKYVSHDVSTFYVVKSLWTVATLELKDIPRFGPQNGQVPFIEEAKRREGILSFGSGPFLDDGSCRIVQSLINKAQLQVDPFKAVKYSDVFRLAEKRGSPFALLTLRVGNIHIPYEPGFQNQTTSDFYKFHAQKVVSSITEESNNGGAVHGKLVVTYNLPTEYAQLGITNVVAPSARLPDVFKILLKQHGLAFCHCRSDIRITRVSVDLKEYLTCNVILDDGYGIQTDVRTLNIQDIKFDEKIRNSEYARLRGDISVDVPEKLFNCKLPNLGPTFFSNNCTRGYVLEFSVTVECLDNRCMTTFKVSTNINVAVETFKVNVPLPIQQATKEQDLVHIETLPKSPYVMQTVSQSVLQKARADGLLEHHTCSFVHDEAVVTIFTVSQSTESKIQCVSQSKFKRPEVDYANAVIFRREGYTFGTSYYARQLFKSRHLSIFSDFKDLHKYLPNQNDFCLFFIKKKPYAINHIFAEVYTIRLSCPKTFHVGLKMISIGITQRRIMKVGDKLVQNERTGTLLSDTFRAVGGRAFENRYEFNDEQMVTVPDDFVRCSFPALLPSTVSNNFSIEYHLVVKLKVSVMSFLSIKVVATDRLTVYNEKHSESLPPPCYDE